MSDDDRFVPPAPLVALCGWILPGLGYFLIGQRRRAMIAGATVLLTFLAGVMIGGIRVIDVPGYAPDGQQKMVRYANTGVQVWAVKANPTGEIMNKPWYIAQTLVGPVNFAATYVSLAAAENHRMSTARIFDIGTLYTAVAGMLNLLIIIDATYRSTLPPIPEMPSPERGRPFDEQGGQP
ncbi:MAG: hypothetical protein QM754_20515 [Tepidisphaeraceae bacterium]